MSKQQVKDDKEESSSTVKVGLAGASVEDWKDSKDGVMTSRQVTCLTSQHGNTMKEITEHIGTNFSHGADICRSVKGEKKADTPGTMIGASNPPRLQRKCQQPLRHSRS